jgi:hypothetical protein
MTRAKSILPNSFRYIHFPKTSGQPHFLLPGLSCSLLQSYFTWHQGKKMNFQSKPNLLNICHSNYNAFSKNEQQIVTKKLCCEFVFLTFPSITMFCKSICSPNKHQVSPDKSVLQVFGCLVTQSKTLLSNKLLDKDFQYSRCMISN